MHSALLFAPHVNNSPLNYTDPSGHKGEDGCGAYGCAKENLLSKIFSKFQNVDIKNPDDWKISELRVLDHTLNRVLKAFDNSLKTFSETFGNITFEIVDDLGEGVTGNTDAKNGYIQLTHWGFTSEEVIDIYGTNEWSIAHELGHVFDYRQGRPSRIYGKLYPNTVYDSLLGVLPVDYDCTGTSYYGCHGSSKEDFAEAFAAVIVGDPKNVISADREFWTRIFMFGPDGLNQTP